MAYEPVRWSQRVATNIKQAIDHSEKSLNRLSEETGIPLSTLFRRYRAQNPWDTTQIEALADALEKHPDDLMLTRDDAAEAS